MNLEQVEQLVFDSLAETLAELGCAGPPTCKLEGCKSKGKHDTGCGISKGVIEIMIDGQEYDILVKAKGA